MTRGGRESVRLPFLTAALLPGLPCLLACREGAGTTPEVLVPVASLSAAMPAVGCAAATRLVPNSHVGRSTLLQRSSTDTAIDSTRSQLSSCVDASAGPEAWFALDLSGFEAPVEVHAVVDAQFDALLELRSGACGDSVSLDCDRARGLAASSSSLAARLEPAEYWLVVDGADAQSSGDYQLQVELDPAPGRCAASASNGTCSGAARLEPLQRQTVLLDEACAVAGDDDEPSLWYELDLRAEPEPVLVHAAVWTLAVPALQRLYLYGVDAAGECASELGAGFFSRGLGRTGAELSTLLPAGRYRYRVALAGEPQRRVGLQLDVDREACRLASRASGLEGAIVLDGTASSQVRDGNTACNTDQLRPRCAEVDAPEQLYQLDLRAAERPLRARVTVLVDGLGFAPVLSLLDGADVTNALYCDARVNAFEGPPSLDLTLQPQLYHLAVDGAEPGAAGPYRLLVELEPAQPRACVDTRIDDCVERNAELDCCLEWGPACDTTVELCGLARETQACLCEQQPSCCSPERVPGECAAALGACGYLCPAFEPSEARCLAPP